MVHLFKHTDGTFDIARVHANGNFIAGSQQHYENKGDALDAIRSGMHDYGNTKGYCYFQDDTGEISKIYLINDLPAGIEGTDLRPHNRYTPGK